MKKLLYFTIGIIPLLVACAAEPPYDNATAAVYSDIEKIKEDIKDQSRGNFRMVWIVDKQVVDTAEFICNDEVASIKYLPADYLIKQVMPDIKREDISFTDLSAWPMNVKMNGFSENGRNTYFLNSKYEPHCILKIKQVEYEFIPFIHTDQLPGNYTSLIYDLPQDIWSGTAPLDSFQLTNLSTYKIYSKHYNPMLNLSFQTIERIK